MRSEKFELLRLGWRKLSHFSPEDLHPHLTPLIIGIAGLWIDSRNTRRAAEKDERDISDSRDRMHVVRRAGTVSPERFSTARVFETPDAIHGLAHPVFGRCLCTGRRGQRRRG
jgi:hypothetical protein